MSHVARWPIAFAMSAAIVLGSGCAARKARPEAGGAVPAASGAHHDDTSRPQSSRYRKAQDGGPGAPPVDIADLVEPVPKVEPRSRYGNKSSYTVLGRTYRVLASAKGYSERGLASWYGNKFHGYMTSSFEPYDMYAFSAAHKTLPLPTYVRVTNLANGKNVVVRVNDRGPFIEGRIIDLSYAAAVRIGIWPKGTGMVQVDAIDPEHPRAARPAPRAQPGARIHLQLGAFGERANAEALVRRAARAGIDSVHIETTRADGRILHRVRTAPLGDAQAADELGARIERAGLGTPTVIIEE